MSAAEWPLRVRLYGGRNTHAARVVEAPAGHTTPCGYYLAKYSTNNWQDNDVKVTCATCIKRMPAAPTEEPTP